MKINHHLDETTLLSYVAGSLSQGMALVVASHISLCSECQKRVEETEAIGGALLQQMRAHEMSDTALDRALSQLDQFSPEESLLTTTDRVETTNKLQQSDVPAPLRDYIGNSLDSVKWRHLAPGFCYFDVLTEQSGVCRLLKVSPGKSILPHTHQGNELTQLLRGSYADEVGCFTQGDIADLDDQTEHQPLVDGNEDCICLVATDSPLKFTTMLGKMLQPVTGF